MQPFNSLNSGRLRPIALACLLGFASPLHSTATTLHYWDGGSASGSYWTDNANWLGGAPVGGDQRLIFQDNAARKVNTNNLANGTAFESIWIRDNNYNIHGNRVTTDYVRAGFASGTTTFNPDITASGTLYIYVETNNTRLVLTGDIGLTSDSVVVNSLLGGSMQGDLTLSGAITGTGSFFKDGGGETTMNGSGANTYSGITSVQGGILRLNKSILGFGVTAIPNDLIIGAGTNGLTGDIVVLDFSHQIANDSHVTVNGTGQFDLNDNSETIGLLTLQGGDVITGTGLLTLSSNVFCLPTTATSLIAGKMSLGSGASRTFYVYSPSRLNVTAAVSGGSGVDLIKTASGDLWLAGTNTYSGTTIINLGTLTVANDLGLGSTNEGTILKDGATLQLFGVDVGHEHLIVSNGFSHIIEADGGSNSWAGEIEFKGSPDVVVASGDYLNLKGILSGPFGFGKYGTGTLRLSGTSHNTFGGILSVHEGTIELQKTGGGIVAISGQLNVGGHATPAVAKMLASNEFHDTNGTANVLATGTLDMNGFSDIIGNLFGSGEVIVSGAGVLTVNPTGASNTFSGVISGTGSLKKQGSSRLLLSGTNTYTGSTTILEGQLRVNGAITASPISLAGGWLTGTGTVTTITCSGPSSKTIAPGGTMGTLKSGSVIMDANTTFEIQLTNTGTGNFDQLKVTGTVNLANAALVPLLTFAPALGDSFVILDNDGIDAVIGTFAGLSEGAIFGINGIPFQISYAGGTGNDVTLRRVYSSAQLGNVEMNGGNFELQGQGGANVAYVIEASTNLFDWSPIQTNLSDGTGLFMFIDQDSALYPHRFYRAVSP